MTVQTNEHLMCADEYAGTVEQPMFKTSPEFSTSCDLTKAVDDEDEMIVKRWR